MKAAARIFSSTTARSSARATSPSTRTRRCSTSPPKGRRAPRRRTSRSPPASVRVTAAAVGDAAVAAPHLRAKEPMGARNPQTQAKRAREFAVKEKRERKRAKKAENAALRAAGIDPYADALADSTEAPTSEPEKTEG